MFLRVGIPNFNHPPDYVRSEETGKWSGLFIDILEELSKKQNFRLFSTPICYACKCHNIFSYKLIDDRFSSFDATG